ncbi:hypothetical protein Nepgr_002838 [Nepenthes gracilis]|uniref:Uncharacterized protein n=1 Tax=Nepenthes gracilis TaxID=150966 RepID=A0AAD3PA40_NEPGR|nr:hypothetical protein Nepgr_002838 [Nepenthes gracilis]
MRSNLIPSVITHLVTVVLIMVLQYMLQKRPVQGMRHQGIRVTMILSRMLLFYSYQRLNFSAWMQITNIIWLAVPCMLQLLLRSHDPVRQLEVYAPPWSDQARSMKQIPYLKLLKSIIKKPRGRQLAFPSLPDLIGTDCRRVGVAKD